ncbi:hypothetical protein JCM8097_003771 [Rhodosporidiobolus ruineniae]
MAACTESTTPPGSPTSAAVLPLVPDVVVEERDLGGFVEEDERVDQGLIVLPYLGGGKRQFTVDGSKYSRYQLVHEYVRRRTGVSILPTVIRERVRDLRAAYRRQGHSLPTGLSMDMLDPLRLATTDWAAVLGPDLYPETKPPVLPRSDALPASNIARKEVAKPKRPAPDPALSFLVEGVSPPKRVRRVKYEQDSDFVVVRDDQPDHVVQPRSTFLPSYPSASLLTSAIPSRDFAASSQAIHALGLSISALADLFAAEDHLADVLMDAMIKRAKLMGLEAGWAKKVFKRTRRFAPATAYAVPAGGAVKVEEVEGAILETRWGDSETAGQASPVQPRALTRRPSPDPVSLVSHEVKPAVKEEAGEPEYGSRQIRVSGAQLEAEAEHRRSSPAESPNPSSSSNVVPSRPTGWTVEAHQALIRGLALFPFLGRGMRFFLIDGQRYNRNRLLNEYIRRQTGCTFNYDKIQQAIGQLRTEYKEAANPPRGLGTDKLDNATLETCDWKALLGEDLYPETKAASEAADAKAQMKRTMANREASRRKRSKRTPPHSLYLQAVLTSAFPSHDFSSAAVASSSASLATLDDLHRLLVLEDFLVEPLVEMVVKRAKLSGIEAGWVRKALARLRSSLAAEAG